MTSDARHLLGLSWKPFVSIVFLPSKNEETSTSLARSSVSLPKQADRRSLSFTQCSYRFVAAVSSVSTCKRSRRQVAGDFIVRQKVLNNGTTHHCCLPRKNSSEHSNLWRIVSSFSLVGKSISEEAFHTAHRDFAWSCTDVPVDNSQRQVFGLCWISILWWGDFSASDSTEKSCSLFDLQCTEPTGRSNISILRKVTMWYFSTLSSSELPLSHRLNTRLIQIWRLD